MLLSIRHHLRYVYDRPVFLEPMTLRLTPKQDCSQQLLGHSLRLEAEPAGSSAIQAADGSGALVCWFSQERDQLEITMEARVRTLEAEIARETARVTGEGNSLTQKSADFQRLALEADFAAKNMASALAGYENSLSEAQRQQVYLERIAQPSKPDRAQEPRRLRSVFITFLLGLVIYGIASMVVAGVREHMD